MLTSSIDTSNCNNSLISTIDCIRNSLLCDSHLKQELINIATRFSTSSNFTFYTDGCVRHIGTPQCVSGYGWLQANPHFPRLEFKGSTIFFPSSTKSEAMAILMALITLPTNSTCLIFTNSANCILTFNSRLHQLPLSSRRCLKINNFLIWDLIFYLISHFHLMVSLHKVKGHSNDPLMTGLTV